MDDNKKMISMMEEMLKRMRSMEDKMTNMENRMDSMENRMDSMENRMDNMEKTEKAHFEHTCNEFERLEKKIDSSIKNLDEKIDSSIKNLDEKIDSNFKNLDEKIDITKEKVVLEVIDGVEEISATASKLISKVENKVDTEVKERKFQFDKLKNLTEYEKIVLKNLESRVSILEEESQNYNGK